MEDHTACGDHVFPLLYPLNKSLAEEIERLFSKWSFTPESAYCGTAEGKHIHDNKIILCISLETLVIFQSVPPKVSAAKGIAFHL
jgi:hypothetical protein